MKYLLTLLLLAATVAGAVERIGNYDITIESDGESFIVTYRWYEGPYKTPTWICLRLESGEDIYVVHRSKTFHVASLADIKPTPQEMEGE